MDVSSIRRSCNRPRQFTATPNRHVNGNYDGNSCSHRSTARPCYLPTHAMPCDAGVQHNACAMVHRCASSTAYPALAVRTQIYAEQQIHHSDDVDSAQFTLGDVIWRKDYSIHTHRALLRSNPTGRAGLIVSLGVLLGPPRAHAFHVRLFVAVVFDIKSLSASLGSLILFEEPQIRAAHPHHPPEPCCSLPPAKSSH